MSRHRDHCLPGGLSDFVDLQVVTDSVELGQAEVKGLCHVTATTMSATRAEIRLSDFVVLLVLFTGFMLLLVIITADSVRRSYIT